MSDASFGRFFPYRTAPDGGPQSVEIGVLRLAPGATVAEVQRRLRATLPDDVRPVARPCSGAFTLFEIGAPPSG